MDCPPFDALVGWYDAIYAARGKSHRAEAEAILRAVEVDTGRAEETGAGVDDDAGSPAAERPRLLDVACGTGEHLRWFGRRTRAEGLDAHPGMRRVAREKLPEVPIHAGDMRSFRLEHRFDVITCLFASVGYLDRRRDLRAAIDTMIHHLVPGGRLVVEPALFPADVRPPDVQIDHVSTPDGVVQRRTSAEHRGEHLHVRFELTGNGQHHVETHRIRLFEPADYAAAFDAANATFALTDVPGAGTLYIARRPISTG